MTEDLRIVRTVDMLRKDVAQWKQEGYSVGLVPTMGNLHEGHLSLMDQIRQKADKVIATIFVNPKQFGEGEDFDSYPRTETNDAAKLRDRGVEMLFAPNGREMYPEGFSSSVAVSGPMTQCLCGASRPAFLGGVATVVTKLLLQALPDVAIFGEKDYQQLQVIKRFVTDLNIPVEIMNGTLIREADGLAMSSRNQYLSPSERETAAKLAATMRAVLADVQDGMGLPDALAKGHKTLEAVGFTMDYFEFRDGKDLRLLEAEATETARLFAASWFGEKETRLIDNMSLYDAE